MAGKGKNGAKRKAGLVGAEKPNPVQQRADERYALLHPQLAADEHQLKQIRAMAVKAHGHRRHGTVETHFAAAITETRQGSLARLHRTGAISADQLGWALEITAEHDRINAEVAVRGVSFDTRVDMTRMGDATFFEELGRVRRAQAYTRWRAGLASICRDRPDGLRHVLAMVVDDLGVTWAAKHLRMSVRRARKLLLDALELWPKMMGQVKDDIDEEDLIAMEMRLAR